MSIAKDNIGQGKKVALRVIDDRNEQLIGKRGYYGPGAKITTEQDLAELLHSIVSQGLYQKGFVLVQESIKHFPIPLRKSLKVIAEGDFLAVKPDESQITLKIELRVLEYKSAMGLWTGGNIGIAAVKAIATLPSGKSYEKSYRDQKDVRTIWASSQETNARVVNEALAKVINKMFEDQKLLVFLASE